VVAGRWDDGGAGVAATVKASAGDVCYAIISSS
jgi:hypothetical protein